MLLPWTRPLPHMSRSVHSSFTVASHPTCNHRRLLYPYVRATVVRSGVLPTLYSGQQRLWAPALLLLRLLLWACSHVRAADLLAR